jgi:hypothetical protein
MKTFSAFIGFFLAIHLALLPAPAEGKTPEALEQQYQKEKNPRKQAEIARKLLVLRLEALRARIGTGVMLEESSPELDHYQSGVEMLARAVREAAHTKTSKEAEKALFGQENDLGNLRRMVSTAEHPLIDSLLEKVSALKEELLYGLHRLNSPSGAAPGKVSQR